MGLPRKHIPFSRSLRARVLEEFAPEGATPENPPGHDELVAFLARSRDTDSSPLATIKRHAARQNRSADLRADDLALLTWVCEAFGDWEEHYPLEAPLRDQLRRLLPLAVAMALTDDDFTTPGQHALHQLLDALQAGAVGWQVRLDRAGQMLEQRVERAVDKALEWFRDPALDIAAITRELSAANERDAARAQRMVQRLAETEQARLRTLTARRDAALFINRGLAKYELPSAIGEFLKGPWNDSAQLILVKYGNDSQQWQQMRRATKHLFESVQDRTGEDEQQRDRREQMLRHLPSELRRWLLSLEHDSDATDSAIGLVEYAHLRLQHGQELQRGPVQLLDVEDDEEPEDGSDVAGSRIGEWYRFEDDEGELRAQLVLALANDRHLLFANFVGLKALDLPRQAFLQRVEDGFAVHLPNVCTYSLSLASAAGIRDEDSYRQFLDPNYRPRVTTPAPDTSTAAVEPVIAQDWNDELPPPASPAASSVAATEPPVDPVLQPPEGAETEFSLDIDLEAGEPPGPADDRRATQAPPTEPTRGPGPEGQPARPSPADPSTAAPAAAPPQASPPAPGPEPAAPPPPITPKPGEWDQPSGASPATPPPRQRPPVPAAPTAQVDPGPPEREQSPPVPDAAPPQQSPPARDPAPTSAGSTREVDVPMGAWLGFHDGETPIMAKLAVFDPRRDNYIFVNRKGIALRELNRAELLELMDRGLVDILETRSYFRDEVERARGKDP